MIKHTLFRRGRVWFVDFRFRPPGAPARRYRISTGSERKADAERIAEYKVRATVEQVMGGSQHRLAELLTRYGAYSRAVNSSKWMMDKTLYLKRFARAMGNRPLAEITPYDCQRYQQAVMTRLTARGRLPSKVHVNREMSVIKHLFNMAVEWGMMKQSPARKLRYFRESPRYRYLSREELAALLQALEAWAATHRRMVMAVRIALLTGLRMGEILALRWSDIRDRFFLIPSPKERRAKMVPIPPRLRGALQALDTGSEYVVGGPGLTRTTVFRQWREICRAAGIKDARFHDLRHTFATLWAQGGTNLLALKDTLGHASLAMTQRYAHSTAQDQLDAVGEIEARVTGCGVPALGPKRGLRNGQERAGIGGE